MRTQVPPNSESIITFATDFQRIINLEISKGRYIGPLTREDVEAFLGPFQSSPLAIIPKPGRPGRFRLVQNFSFPHAISYQYPNASVNSAVDSDDFPCTWGTFNIVALLICRLPPGSQGATRDVAEAYRTVPIHYTQWPGAVVRVSQSRYCIDTAVCFGESPSVGTYGYVADAGADLFRSYGIGPLSKWVDDHFFFHILRVHLHRYNHSRKLWHDDITTCGQHHNGGHIWYGGQTFDDSTLEEFDDDCQFPIKDLSALSPRSEADKAYTYCFADIDRLSENLGFPWECSKDTLFASVSVYIGLSWDLQELTVGLGSKKRQKYLSAIQEWQCRVTHNLKNVQKLYGKLLHTCLVIPRGRAYLTGLEAMLGLCRDRVFMQYSPVKEITEDLIWWHQILC
ncbi:hypothetical protein SCP_1602810 [Sparassis crispa]|uniref:Uncharacterized protein n=1 Tax=Sparassis crispa TaxID=139825 RepID=A0A401H5A3_9APHY|nr:hypothetical protein SCP_1602810 [Sparassis crispa]GBE89618.1 hypothetical protein SCP_1602810 [Sparassis crispa]